MGERFLDCGRVAIFSIHSPFALVQVFFKLLRRYKYLQKVFEEELRKMVNFLKGFSEDERQRLATFTAVAILDGVTTKASTLKVLTNEHLTRDGLSLQFITQVFQVCLYSYYYLITSTKVV